MNKLVDGIIAFVVLGQVSLGQACKAPTLTPTQQHLLRRYHFLLTSQGLLLDAHLIGDCEIRQRIAGILQHSLGRDLAPEEEQFLRVHKVEWNQVVRSTWPAIGVSPAFPEDGAILEEKWLILQDSNIDDQTLNNVALRELARNGLSDDAAFLLFHRMTARLKVEVSRIADSSKYSHRERLFGIAIMSQYDKTTPLFLVQNMMIAGFTPQEKHALEFLHKQLDAGGVLNWDNFAPLLGPTD